VGRVKQTVSEKRVEKRDILLARRGGQCRNCGLMHVGDNGYLFDFHHLDNTTKEFDMKMSNMDRKMVNLYAEADKCEILCANCHRSHHHHKTTK
jgi:hypothetical protein